MAFFDLIGGAAQDLFEAKGHGIAQKGYKTAEKLARQSGVLSEASTRVKQTQLQREAYRITGGAQADLAGAGFAATGSGLDIMRANAAEAALDRALTGIQGAIEKNDFISQAESYKSAAEQEGVKKSGSIFSSVVKGVAAVASLFSDRRLKEDIRPIGTADNGLQIYSYRLKGERATRIGFMADEVAKLHPDAVSEVGGYLMVDYKKAVR